MMRSSIRTYEQARRLRTQLSRAEVLLWVRLRERLPDIPTFRRQHPIGPYIADFCCSIARLVVEVDGGVHNMPDRQLKDSAREAYLRDHGYRVLRLTDKEVLADPDAAAATIRAAATGPLRRPPVDTSPASQGRSDVSAPYPPIP